MAYRSPRKEGLLLAAVMLVAAAGFVSLMIFEAQGRVALWVSIAVRVVLAGGMLAMGIWLRNPRAKQLSLLAVAAVLVVTAGTLPGPALAEISQEAQLVPPDNVLARTRPEVALLTMAPGGLRAIVFNYLWIRSQQLHQEGKHHDAYQLARLICMMQPRFAGVWQFQSWQMAWNISVTCDTPEERWQWIYNGIKLLRDEGAEANPASPAIYGQLAWTFLEKVGGDMDDFHYAYKQRWAKMMQDVLSPPPFETTDDALQAFAPIAAAPIDKNSSHRAGIEEGYVQADQLKRLLEKPAPGQPDYFVPKTADYVEKFRALGVRMDKTFLTDVYDRYSLDEGVSAARSGLQAVKPPETDDHATALYILVNDPDYATARGYLLAFLRAQVLWNEFRMDPKLMLRIMTEDHVPLDWRLPIAHALYWNTYGQNVTNFVRNRKADVASMKIDRMDMNALKALTWYGRVVYQDNPANPDYPQVTLLPDWRYMEPAHQRHIQLARRWVADKQREGDPQPFGANKYRDGHINYLIDCMQMLYVLRRPEQATRYLDYVRKTYKPAGEQWQLPLPEFVAWQIAHMRHPTQQQLEYLMSASLESAMVSLALGDRKRFVEYASYAARTYGRYRGLVPERSRSSLKPLDFIVAQKLGLLLARPRSLGYSLPLSARIKLFKDLQDVYTPAPGMPHPCVLIYDEVAPDLKTLCEAAGEPFAQAFPEPPGLKQFRARTNLPDLQLRGTGGR